MTISLCSSSFKTKTFCQLLIAKKQDQTKDLNKDPDGPWSLMEPQTHLAMALAPSLHLLQADIRLSPPDYASVEDFHYIQTRLDQINLIDEKRLESICHGQIYQKRMIRAFNKKVKHRVYQVGDLVVKRIILPQGDPRGK